MVQVMPPSIRAFRKRSIAASAAGTSRRSAAIHREHDYRQGENPACRITFTCVARTLEYSYEC